MTIQNGNALQLGECGVLIIGPSGAGKSVLTLALIERSHLAGRKAALVGDDYVELAHVDGQLFAHTPAPIAGAMEIRGAGLFKMDFVEKVRLELVIKLDQKGDRYPENHYFEALGCRIPLLVLPQLGAGEMLALCHAVEATLFKTRWYPDFAAKNY